MIHQEYNLGDHNSFQEQNPDIQLSNNQKYQNNNMIHCVKSNSSSDSGSLDHLLNKKFEIQYADQEHNYQYQHFNHEPDFTELQGNQTQQQQQQIDTLHRIESIKSKKQKRMKESTIKQAIMFIKIWKKIYQEVNQDRGKNNKKIVTLKQCAEIMKKCTYKTLNDYLLLIRKAECYKFKFTENLDQKFGLIRKIIKETEQNKQQDTQEQSERDHFQQDNQEQVERDHFQSDNQEQVEKDHFQQDNQEQVERDHFLKYVDEQEIETQLNEIKIHIPQRLEYILNQEKNDKNVKDKKKFQNTSNQKQKCNSNENNKNNLNESEENNNNIISKPHPKKKQIKKESKKKANKVSHDIQKQQAVSSSDQQQNYNISSNYQNTHSNQNTQQQNHLSNQIQIENNNNYQNQINNCYNNQMNNMNLFGQLDESKDSLDSPLQFFKPEQNLPHTLSPLQDLSFSKNFEYFKENQPLVNLNLNQIEKSNDNNQNQFNDNNLMNNFHQNQHNNQPLDTSNYQPYEEQLSPKYLNQDRLDLGQQDSYVLYMPIESLSDNYEYYQQ